MLAKHDNAAAALLAIRSGVDPSYGIGNRACLDENPDGIVQIAGHNITL
jgi:hypothetical protein